MTRRLLLLTHSYAPEHSPPQRRWEALIGHLGAHGWEATVVCPVAHYAQDPDADPHAGGRAWRAQQGAQGERILRVPFLSAQDDRRSKLADQLVTAAASVVRGGVGVRCDAVVVTAPSLPLLASGWLLSLRHRVPLVVEMRDAWPDLAREARVSTGAVQRVVARAVEFVQSRADVVVTVTQGFAQALRSRGLPRVATVRNGVELAGIPVLPPVPAQRDRLEVLYLGNHGESQRLELLIEAAALVGPETMRLTMVGQGSRKAALQAHARSLGVPVRFLDPVYCQGVFDRYQDADSLVISLRDDWTSFEATVPSKTYEVMSVGRHLTAVVRGEAAELLRSARTADIVDARAESIAALWRRLAADRSRLREVGDGRAWVAAHADYRDLASEYAQVLDALLPPCGAGS